MRLRTKALTILAASAACASAWAANPLWPTYGPEYPDTLPLWLDSAAPLLMLPQEDPLTLSDQDYQLVADMLNVDEAALHAVVDIEAGLNHSGFSKPGTPVVAFSLSSFQKRAKERGININKFKKTHPKVFASARTQDAVAERVRQAMAIDSVAAIEATFWGMFQIGGFNWRLCGAESPIDFYNRMSKSEREQVELFANFLHSTGLDKPLQAHDWKKFARGYNGPSYAKRGYHTRLAKAYKKYSK